ncbi:hypothetical protein C2857_006457 [Epichloe festucae Fl1]|uniref:Uncharacterized protein n=1 Tax=Epichloe festucae (strain Fl1) TaxID=877507 RepID=A0A7S9PUN8_EPIFF|nr:hypothetical protein C2857_006457 [Epichloe festucae Fl1]
MKLFGPFSLAIASTLAAGRVHKHDSSFNPNFVLSVTQQNISIGGMYRESVLVNNSLPGPTLRIQENEVVWIRVYNNMAHQNLTMHWHGLALAAYPFSDGTPLASQWPIPPHHYFDYQLKAETSTAGTYYYHSHVGFQANTATGALIVDDPRHPPYKTNGERIVFLQEYWNRTDAEIESGLEASPMRWAGEPNGWLINGKSISNYRAVDASTRALSVIKVNPGETYRFRFVGATALSLALMGIEKHGNKSLEIIEADGQYTRPYPVDLLQIGSGQRYSALFRAKSCAELLREGRLDYYVQLESRDRPKVVTNYAVLSYKNTCRSPRDKVRRLARDRNPERPPMTLPPTIAGYLDYVLQPLFPNDAPTAKEVTRRVILNTQLIENQYFIWTINDNAWSEGNKTPRPITVAEEPYLVALYKNQTAYLPDYKAAIANGGLDPKTKTYPAKVGEVIEIVFQQHGARSASGLANGTQDTHPLHAHGRHYHDMGGARGAWSPEVAEQQLRGTQPVLRDTTLLYRYDKTVGVNETHGWRSWRVRVTQPGVWMVHCHTLQHMVMGMQTVWVHGDAEDIMKTGKPAVNGYLVYGGDVNGNETHAPRVVHFDEEVHT